MREILFRGQTRRWGERRKNAAGDPLPSNWEYGGLFYQNDRGGDYSIIYSYDPVEKYVVYADTVGQYTGLDDKNGQKIFEGDILSFANSDGDVCYLTVVYDRGMFMVEERGIICREGLCEVLCLGIEVAGNIYDNPELLKRGQDK